MFGRRKKQRKLPEWDDGRTVAEMNVEGMPWYQPTSGKKVKEEDKPTRRETRAMIRAGFLAYLPRFFAILVGFGLAVFFVYLWLNGWTL